MVSDCLAPVITEKGVATIVTADSLKALGDDMQFRKITVESFPFTGQLYGIILHHESKRSTWYNAYRRIYLTEEALLRTADGWTPITEINTYMQVGADQPRRYVMCYNIKCGVCGKWYVPVRPYWSVCGNKCMKAALDKKLFVVKPLNANTVNLCLKPEWVELSAIRPLEQMQEVEAVRVTSIEDGDSLFINGVLLSSKTLQNRVKLENRTVE